jgi:hypothetical protein
MTNQIALSIGDILLSGLKVCDPRPESGNWAIVLQARLPLIRVLKEGAAIAEKTCLLFASGPAPCV